MYIYIYIYAYISLYIYRERERQRDDIYIYICRAAAPAGPRLVLPDLVLFVRLRISIVYFVLVVILLCLFIISMCFQFGKFKTVPVACKMLFVATLHGQFGSAPTLSSARPGGAQRQS